MQYLSQVLVDQRPVAPLLPLELHLEVVAAPPLEHRLHHGEVGAEDGEALVELERLLVSPVHVLPLLAPAPVVGGDLRDK